MANEGAVAKASEGTCIIRRNDLVLTIAFVIWVPWLLQRNGCRTPSICVLTDHFGFIHPSPALLL